MVNGIFITATEIEGVDHLLPTIEYGKQVCTDCINNFSETGNVRKNFEWMVDKIHKAQKYLDAERNEYDLHHIVNIGHMIVIDLCEVIKDKQKLEMLNVVMEVLDGLSDQIDPEGIHFIDYDRANQTVQHLYEILSER